MGYTCFEVEEADNVAHIRLNRPEQLNSMIPAFWAELPEIIDGLSDGGRTRAVVLSSTGKHFCAGMDLSVFGGAGLEGEETLSAGRRHANFRYNVLHLQRAFTALEEARMPVLAAIQGGAVGGAVDLITAADCRYATEDAWFCIQEINIGMTADVGTLQRLPKLIPEGIVRELAYTGRRMSATRAAEVGLVNEVFADHDAMLSGVHEIAAEIASKTPLAVHGTKEMINFTRDHSVQEGLKYMALWQTGMFQPSDMAEAFTAMKEKRDATFEDLGEVRRGL
ncbi:MAG: crotonase/enoyl-CoA hydratase family protein [Acidimicrobiales bacterium]|jgi:enoyl-CoA hydratase|nr:crotonase/enoyl-CoA hydratase family protein [Acidimicrobiales bacterium]MDG2217088.1 crotonase/enoyl-CoA hydratase family protein [Acidimicrobiales bacterium]